MDIKIQNLKIGDFFRVNGYDSIFKFLGQPLPKVYTGDDIYKNVIEEFNYDTIVKKIDGFELYLLYGGRDWY